MGLYDHLPAAMRPFAKISPGYTKTYQIRAPKSTHFRKATCQEVNCLNYQNGWISLIDTSTELGVRQANYIRLHSGRHFTHKNVSPDSPVVEFTFPAGQTCFAEHNTRIERPEIFVVRDGDWRGNPRGTAPRVHVNGDDWVDDFANHQQKIVETIERG